jgi:hypothetical protein
MLNIWKIVASNWRTISENEETTFSMDELMDEVTEFIINDNLLSSNQLFLDDEDDTVDDDNDWP